MTIWNRLDELSRKSLGWIVLFDTVVMALLTLLVLLFPGWRETSVFVACIWFTLFVLHGLMVPFKGLDYVPNDESPNNPLSRYWIASIAVAVLLAFPLSDYVLNMIG